MLWGKIPDPPAGWSSPASNGPAVHAVADLKMVDLALPPEENRSLYPSVPSARRRAGRNTAKRLRAVQNLEYLSIDLESPLAMKKMDITRLELPDASYDIIFCNHVFEHIPDDRAAMRELFRVLKLAAGRYCKHRLIINMTKLRKTQPLPILKNASAGLGKLTTFEFMAVIFSIDCAIRAGT